MGGQSLGEGELNAKQQKENTLFLSRALIFIIFDIARFIHW
jgi:hypothetical protein